MLADAQLSSLVRRMLRAEAEVTRRAAVNAANLVRDIPNVIAAPRRM